MTKDGKVSASVDKDVETEGGLETRLAPFRVRIDELDAQLIALLNQRAQVALDVGEIKKEYDAPVYRPERERQVIAKVQGTNRGPLKNEHIATIWLEIMSASRALEEAMTVAYLGPQGTYSEQAAMAYFGKAIEMEPCASIDEVFRSVEAGGVRYGVVPVENSTEGAVSRTLDLLFSTKLSITGEIAIPIHHNLLSLSGDLTAVKVVCAHPQALAQCQRWLAARLPQAERRAVSSNAEGARLAAGDPSVAAIAGDRAGALYGLQTAAAQIQDDPHNRTRFYVLGGTPSEATGMDQTSLIVSVPNKPGAVYKMLEPLSRLGVSMTRFESRPARSGNWEYFFHIDILGHRTDSAVAAALAELQEMCSPFRILGSYPRAKEVRG